METYIFTHQSDRQIGIIDITAKQRRQLDRRTVAEYVYIDLAGDGIWCRASAFGHPGKIDGPFNKRPARDRHDCSCPSREEEKAGNDLAGRVLVHVKYQQHERVVWSGRLALTLCLFG